jgi:hypothetical protein
MATLFDIATKISTPLALAGFIAAAFFLILRQLLTKKLISQVQQQQSANIIILIINRLFFLSLIALLLGSLAYLAGFAHQQHATAPNPAQIHQLPRTGLGSVETLLDEYQKYTSYQDTSLLTVTMQMDTNALQLIATSHFYHQKPDKLRVNSTATLKLNGMKLMEAKYQIFTNTGHVIIYSQDLRKYISITNGTLDLLQRNPENEPLKQLGLAALKAYQFALSGDKPALLSRIVSAKASHISEDGSLLLSLQEEVRAADKWPDSLNTPAVYTIPVELLVKNGLILKPTAQLMEFWRFVRSNTNFLHNSGSLAGNIKDVTAVESEAVHQDIFINEPVPAAYFNFVPEPDAKEVPKLPRPF